MTTAIRYHDISTGHRVYGHENKCAHLHGHNYRITFTISGDLDAVGRVLDFGVIKEKLCMWLEEQWDHKMLIYSGDPIKEPLLQIDPTGICVVPFNPTAENMAEHLVKIVAPMQLKDTGCRLIKCIVEETRKCSAAYESTSI